MVAGKPQVTVMPAHVVSAGEASNSGQASQGAFAVASASDGFAQRTGFATQEKDSLSEVELVLAIHHSHTEAVEHANSELAEALVRSKAEATLPPMWISADGVVRVRLTRHAQSKEVFVPSSTNSYIVVRTHTSQCELKPCSTNSYPEQTPAL